MRDEKTELLQGTLDLLVLKSLSAGPLHGLAVSRRIAQITRGVFEVKPGSLFPALHRLEWEGLVSGSWGRSETNRRAKFYGLTHEGQKRLAAETRQWGRVSSAIGLALKAT